MENFEQTLKRGDTGAPVRAVVVNDSDGQAPDWTGATVLFIMYEIEFETGVMSEVINAAAGIELPLTTSGALRYDWDGGAGDTDRIGRFPSRFKVTDAAGVIESYPDQGFMWINIEEVP